MWGPPAVHHLDPMSEKSAENLHPYFCYGNCSSCYNCCYLCHLCHYCYSGICSHNHYYYDCYCYYSCSSCCHCWFWCRDSVARQPASATQVSSLEFCIDKLQTRLILVLGGFPENYASFRQKSSARSTSRTCHVNTPNRCSHCI